MERFCVSTYRVYVALSLLPVSRSPAPATCAPTPAASSALRKLRTKCVASSKPLAVPMPSADGKPMVRQCMQRAQEKAQRLKEDLVPAKR